MEVCTHPGQVLGYKKIGVPTNFLEILTIFAFKQYINLTKYWTDSRKTLNAFIHSLKHHIGQKKSWGPNEILAGTVSSEKWPAGPISS